MRKKMKRNEFKLLLEDWKKNFIVESPMSPEDVQYFSDDQDMVDTLDSNTDNFSDLDQDDQDLALGVDHNHIERQPHPDGSTALYYPGETDAQDSDGTSPYYYPGESSMDSEGFDHDYSSIGGDDIDNRLPEVDEMVDDDNDGF